MTTTERSEDNSSRRRVDTHTTHATGGVQRTQVSDKDNTTKGLRNENCTKVSVCQLSNKSGFEGNP